MSKKDNDINLQKKFLRLREELEQLTDDHPKRVSTLKEMVKVGENVYGPDHSSVILILQLLAIKLTETARYAEAEPLFLRVLETQEKTLGAEHPDIAEALELLAILMIKNSRYAEAVSLLQRTLEIKEKTFAAEYPKIEMTLNLLAVAMVPIDRCSEAIPLFQRALEIREKALGFDHLDVAALLIHSTHCYKAAGRTADTEPLWQRALKIRGKALGYDHPDALDCMKGLASVMIETAHYTKAEKLCQRVLEVQEKTLGLNHPDVLDCQDRLASVMLATARYDEAEALCLRVLEIREKTFGLNHLDIADNLSTMGSVMIETGRYMEAEPLFARALSILGKDLGIDLSEGTDELSKLCSLGTKTALSMKAVTKIARVMNGLASLASAMCVNYRFSEAIKLLQPLIPVLEKLLSTDQIPILKSFLEPILHAIQEPVNNPFIIAEAENFYQPILKLVDKVYGPEHPEVANLLDIQASVMIRSSRYAEAEKLCLRALAIREKTLGNSHPDVAESLNRLALVKSGAENYPDAESLFRRALVIYEQNFGDKHPKYAGVLCNLANMLARTGNYAKAEKMLFQALAICSYREQAAIDPLVTLSALLKSTGRLTSSIFTGKQAINLLQSLRRNFSQISESVLQSFDHSIEETYKDLADSLISAGRLSEAERVLALLQQRECFDYLRRDSSYRYILTGKIELTLVEKHCDTELTECNKSLAELNKKVIELESRSERTFEQEQELSFLLGKIDQAAEEFQEVLTSLLIYLEPSKKEPIETTDGLQPVLNELEETGVVALSTASTDDKFHLILTTPEQRSAFSSPVGEKELNRLIFELRQRLQDPEEDPEPLARELYEIVLAPAASELQDAGAKTLLWRMEGPLRYIPLCALHDGESYLLEKFHQIQLSPASIAHLKDQPKNSWEALGLGTTGKHIINSVEHNALPFVAEELRGIVPEPLSGEILLDDAFTWGNVKGRLGRKRRFNVVHVASHFHLDVTHDSSSYLLLGDGQPLWLAELEKQNSLFQGVELLVLSACNTGMGGLKERGREISGLACLAERQGAKAVLATLWEVADESTKILMNEFYRQKMQGFSKAEALQLAQLSLLKGPHADEFSHPYFWAPFFLTGNYR